MRGQQQEHKSQGPPPKAIKGSVDSSLHIYFDEEPIMVVMMSMVTGDEQINMHVLGEF